MDKRPSPLIDKQSYLSAHLIQLERRTRYVHGRNPNGDRPGRGSSRNILHFLLGGVIFFQVLIILAILVWMAPFDQPLKTLAATPPSRPVESQPAGGTPPVQPPASPTFQLTDVGPQPDAESSSLALPTPTPQPTDIPPKNPAVLAFRGLEITQGIQVFNEPEHPRCSPDPNQPNHIFCNNSIPLVAGRHTLVRLYPACNGACPPDDTLIRLRLLKDGREQASLTRNLPAQTLAQLNNLSLPQMRSKLAHSVNFEFFPPPAWMVGRITFELEAILPDPAVTSSAALSLSKTFAERKKLRVAYLPVQSPQFGPPEPANLDYWLLRMYPVSAVEYYRLPVPNLILEDDLSKGKLLNKLLFTYWLYAQYQPVTEWPDQLFGWLPPESYNGGVSDPFWCPNCAGPHSSRVAFGGVRPEPDIGGPRILVHEIAHNLGALHAWSPTQQEDPLCFKAEGADIRVDPEWPYAQTPHIQEFGIDLYSNPPVIFPPAAYDMMAYCARPWISPYTYRKLFDSPFLQPEANVVTLPLANFQPQAEPVGGDTLLVSGVVYPDGTVSQPEIVRLEGRAFAGSGQAFTPPVFTPPAGEDYCLNLQTDNDETIAQHCFDTGFVDLETGLPAEASPYFFTLPEPEGRNLSKVTISRKGDPVVVVTPSNTPPDVAVTLPNGGELLNGRQTITWEAHDADGDELHYDLLYSPDGGQSWLPLAVRLKETSYSFYTDQIPPSDEALIRVIATDGFYTSYDRSDAPFTVEAPAGNSFSLRGPATVGPGHSFAVTLLANQVTEPGLFGLQFRLNFDPALLQVDSLSLHPDLNLIAVETIDNNAGQVLVVASRRGRVSPLTGDISLATFNLTPISGPGETNLHLSDVIVGSRDSSPLTLSSIQGVSLYIGP